MDSIFSGIYKKFDKECRFAFIATFLVGFICHGFAFTGYYPNFGSLGVLIKRGSGLFKESRWVSAALAILDGKAAMPFLLGAFSLVFWALSVVCIIRIFDMHSKSAIVLTAACFVCSPVVASMNSFIYMADAFAASTFFACAGALCYKNVRNEKNLKDMCLGIICLICCIATYQPALSVALIIIFIRVGIDTVEEDSLKAIWTGIGKALVMVVLSVAGWYLCDTIIHKLLHIESVVSSMSFNPFAGILSCYKGFVWFIFTGTFMSRLPGRIIVFADIIFVVVMLICRAKVLKEKNLSIVRCIMILGLIALSPIAANYTFIAMPDTAVVCRLFVAEIFFFLLPVIICSKWGEEFAANADPDSIYRYMCIGVTIFAVGTTIFFMEVDNTAYMSAHLKYEKDYSLATRIVDRIESHPEYEKGMPVMIYVGAEYIYGSQIGTGDLDQFIQGMNQQGGQLMYNLTGYTNFIDLFIQNNLNIEWHDINQISQDGIDKMERWPSNDCILVEDGVMYIRLS